MALDTTSTPGQPQDRATRVVMGGMLTARQMGALIAWRRSHTFLEEPAGYCLAIEERSTADSVQRGKRLLFARWLADHGRIGG